MAHPVSDLHPVGEAAGAGFVGGEQQEVAVAEREQRAGGVGEASEHLQRLADAQSELFEPQVVEAHALRRRRRGCGSAEGTRGEVHFWGWLN